MALHSGEASSSFSTFDVFISHAGVDKTTIAIPLREKLRQLGISAFVDEEDMPGGTRAEEAMTEAMKTATVAVVILSPEFVARKWPMRELLCSLRRSGLAEEPREADEQPLHAIIPLFYRLTVKELYQEPKFGRFFDAKRKRIYRESRFFERQANGEPEANVEIIKNALRKLRGSMGIENHVNATNESSPVMSKRREDILNRLCASVRSAVLRSDNDTSRASSVPEGKVDQFQCYYHEEKKKILSGLVLDFSGAHDEGDTRSTEADVLQAVLDSSKNTEVISVQGIGGVGKSSILQGLSDLDAVKERYQGGVHLVSLGADATRQRLIEALCEVIKAAGGEKKVDEMRENENFRRVFNGFRSWFSKQEVLLMIDDVWETAEISSEMIEELLTLHESGLKSKILFTTRSPKIACEAEKEFVLEARTPLGSQCLAILIRHSGIQVDECNVEGNRAVTKILSRCGGLPLFLRIAGKTVKAMKKPSSSDKEGNTYRRYARSLYLRLPEFLDTSVGSYKRLSSTLEVSVQLVEDQRRDWGFRAPLTAAEMQRRLSAFAKNSRVPMTTLRHLWELQTQDEALMVAEKFENIGLGTVETEYIQSKQVSTMRFHDSLHDFALRETQILKEDTLGHKKIVEGYGQGLENEEDCRAWWSKCLEVDGYIHNHICKHLQLCGLEDEVIKLLLKPEWTIRSFEVCGILSLEQDYALGIRIAKRTRNGNQEMRDGRRWSKAVEEALQMVSGAARLSYGFSINHARELCFQLYGRLNIYIEESEVIKEYLNRLEEKGKEMYGPWMRCISSFMTSPGSAVTRIFDIGSPVLRMVLSDDGVVVYCGCEDGKVKAVDMRNDEIYDFSGDAHGEDITCISLSEDQKLLFSGSCSHDDTVKVWNTETRCLLTTCHIDKSEGFQFVKAIGNGRVILIDCETEKVKVADLETGRLLLEPFHIHDHRIFGSGSTEFGMSRIAELSDGEHFVSGGADEKLRIWSSKSGKQLGDAFLGHEEWISCVSVMPDKRHLVSGSRDCTVRIWDIENRAQVGQSFKEHTRSVTCVTVSADGRRVASGSEDGTILVWDSVSGEVCNTLKRQAGQVTEVLFHPVHDTIISCSHDGTLHVWDMSKRNTERIGDRHERAMTCITFTSDGQYAVSGSDDDSLRIWNACSGQQVGDPLLGHSESVSHVEVTPDDERVVSVSFDNTTRVWDLQSQELLHNHFIGHKSVIHSLALTPSGNHAVTSLGDMTVRVWDLTMGEGGHFILDPSYEGAKVWNASVFVTDDGSRVVAAYWSRLLVWDLATRRLVKCVDVDGDKEDPCYWSRKKVMDFVGESSLESDADPICLRGREIWCVGEERWLLLGILEFDPKLWALSPDKKTICAGLDDGRVLFMKLEA